MPYDHLVVAAEERITGQLDAATRGYVTNGGTYVLGSCPQGNDDNRPRDLVAILPLPLDGSRVQALRPTVNPTLITDLREHLDPISHRIVLDFEDEQTLNDALTFIGAINAPVSISGGTVRTGRATHQL